MSVDLIILASGASRRFGVEDKLLANLDGKPVLAHTLQAVALSRVQTIVGVVRPEAAAVCAIFDVFEIGQRRLRIVVNDDAELGMSAAIRAGVSDVMARGAAVVTGVARRGEDGQLDSDAPRGLAILPADMPLIGVDLINELIDVFDAHGGKRVVMPVTRTKSEAGGAAGSEVGEAQRNPVIWPQAMWEGLLQLSGDKGGKALLAAMDDAQVVRVPVADGTHFFDVDTSDAVSEAADLLRKRKIGDVA
ncbi:MAG: nucleotidyltransferase family protein [Pseudomonadota bacterium]